ncbi:MULTISPECIES: protease Lon-related BREX system protein BrxL [Bradyrhizobium]|jgi:ATP-dependent Lon protease|uniref:protease Lon-related BREX system protein BrxL n=1 Tax=Bradyrhizobium TaxID=374 RepID=UPI0004820BAA|nr:MULTISPECIES: protease Lon-related BREX system protein BrxL [Bradyrhizobium]MCS3445945.1 ATP-dependent Lon protease [Bradyrhizobium elkanii]MCS3562923.1 ATP-dependent Lon protease [Bradyrhizobium elkanii]MCW2147241.1 ATP-dependent Lon protease [Bradyrhizobium elkanii]MCW2353681.1 ATP-dependent Lon protease [Bradyrhizobium elkanii]MCW2380072.1 ATP-dependent Lon protease [Bradyrhizobium elkanii]
MSNVPARDALDEKVNRTFAGKVVRKDLVRKVKVGANVPVFVLEFLLGKYCASSDEMAIQMGLQVVNDTLANNYIRSDESMKAQSKVKEKGSWTFIDKVKVRLVDSDYWAELSNFGNKFVHIQNQYVRDYERLLTGGIWAQVDMRFEYDEEGKGKNPFWIEKLTPIQIAAFDLAEYQRLRAEFTTDEWIDLILRSMGYEPGEMTKRLKLLFLTRLIPLCERNYNLVELGPRGTGKSYVIQEVSPYAALMTGPTTVANLFGHMGGRAKGLVQIWDVVGFDEVADLEKMPKEVITTMKTYCESGSFQRGQEAASGEAGIALFGNTQQPIDVMVQTGHLFEPMPEVIRDDMAFIDRLHFYLPGWEVPKMRNDLFTDHYGFVVDYLAEALRELRRHNFTEICDRHFTMGSHLITRDRKAVKKTVSGLMKIIHPSGEATQDEIAELLEFAMEGRRRVKEQLKKMGSFEYYHTSFSYTLNDTGEERFVGVPEQGGRNMISADPLPPGSVYTAAVAPDGTVGMYRVEVSVSSGSGKLKTAGGVNGLTKESINRAFSYMLAKKGELSIARELDVSDLHVEVIDLMNNRVEGEIGLGFFIAAFSALKKAPPSPAMLVVGDLSVQGNIKGLRSLAEPLQLAMDNGAKRALIPIENKRSFLEVTGDVVEHVDPIFFGDPKTAAFKALGIN